MIALGARSLGSMFITYGRHLLTSMLGPVFCSIIIPNPVPVPGVLLLSICLDQNTSWMSEIRLLRKQVG